MSVPPTSAPAPALAPGGPPRPTGFLGALVRLGTGLEDGIVVLTLGVMVLLPLTEVLLRKAFGAGISGSSAFLQHGTLIVGMAGAAVAARKNRLLSLATAEMLPAGWPVRAARLVAGTVAATVAALLAAAAFSFLRDEIDADKVLAYGVPYWTISAVLPVGFALITLYVIHHSAKSWLGRLGVALAAGALIFAFAFCPIAPARLVIPALGVLLIATVLGAPIFVLLGGAALILFWGKQTPDEPSPISSITIAHYSLVTNPLLPTIPLFTLAGYYLAEGGASQRLVRVFTALFGWVRGGPAIVTILICAFFTSFTGASGVTILALGGLLMPILLGAKYPPRKALGLLTGSGALGMLFPPCLPLILYAMIAKVPIEKIFLAAALPGAVLVVLTLILGIWQGPRTAEARPPFNAAEARRALWKAKWELLLPIVALVALFGGFATAVEASALTALYALLSQTVLSRDLKFTRDVPRAMLECGLVIGGVLLILGVSQGFTNYLVDAQVPDQAVEWVSRSVHAPWVFLLLLNVFLLVVGGLMDVYPAIVVVVPLILPIGAVFNINPLHLGVIFLANLELGFLMPPVGMNLLLSSYRFNKPMSEVCRSILPILGVQLIGVLLITYIPWMTTLLPGWFG